MNTIIWHSSKAIQMVAEVLVWQHIEFAWAPQLTGLARLRPSTMEQAYNPGMTYKLT